MRYPVCNGGFWAFLADTIAEAVYALGGNVQE